MNVLVHKKTTTTNRVSKRFRGTAAAASGIALLAATPSAVIAPAASAAIGPCLGQTFNTSSSCTVAPGETIAFTIQGGPGGNGGAGASNGMPGGVGGPGGIGAKVSGTYINNTVSIQTVTVTVGFAGLDGVDGISPGQDGLLGGPGQASSLAVMGGTTIVSVSGGLGGGFGTGGSAGSNGTNGSAGSNGNLTLPVELPSGWTLFSPPPWGIGQVSFTSAPVPAPTTGLGPAPLFQQFGKPASGTCNEVAPQSLNWAGVAGGGWGDSWAQWVNGGKGGAVCTRTLIYSSTLSKWIVE